VEGPLPLVEETSVAPTIQMPMLLNVAGRMPEVDPRKREFGWWIIWVLWSC